MIFKVGFIWVAFLLPFSLLMAAFAMAAGLPDVDDPALLYSALGLCTLFFTSLVYLLFFVAGRTKQNPLSIVWLLVLAVLLITFFVWVCGFGYNFSQNINEIPKGSGFSGLMEQLEFSPSKIFSQIPYASQIVGGAFGIGLFMAWLGSLKGGQLGRAELEYKAYIDTRDDLPTPPSGNIFDRLTRNYIIALAIFCLIIFASTFALPSDGVFSLMFFGGLIMVSIPPAIIANRSAAKYRREISWKRCFKYAGLWSLIFVLAFVALIVFLTNYYGSSNVFGANFSFTENGGNLFITIIGIYVYSLYMHLMMVRAGSKGKTAKLAKEYARSK